MSWICHRCETENHDRLKICEVCDTPRESSLVDELKSRLKEKYCDAAYKTFILNHYRLLESADEGHTNDQYQVGEWFYSRGKVGFSDNYSMIAVFWYRKAAMGGHIDAQVKLASCYEEGRGAPQNKDEAMKWYKKAATEGDRSALVKYLRLKYDNKTYKEVIRNKIDLLSNADKGIRDSQFLLGEWFRSHYREEAVVWYTKAAQSGHVEAMFRLGECYEMGLNVCNFSEALKWYIKAAKGGNKSAQLRLARAYLYGNMIAKDVGEALKWYNLVGKGFDGADLCNIGYAYDIGDTVSVNKFKAVEFYRQAAEKGDSSAQYNLGVCYENGSGVSRNIIAAKYWYKEAAKQGYGQAQQCVSRLKKETVIKYCLWLKYVIMGIVETALFVYYTNEPQNSWIHHHFVLFGTNEIWVELGAIVLIIGACLMSRSIEGAISVFIYGCFAFGFYLNQPDDSLVHHEIFSLNLTERTDIVFELGTTLLTLGAWIISLFDE